MEEELDKCLKVFLVEDNPIDQMAFQRFVEQENLGYDYQIARSIEEAQEILSKESFDIALFDYLLGDGTALDLFEIVTETPVIIITGSGDEKSAVRAMKAGAADYLIKDPHGNYLTTLPSTVEKVIRQKQTEEELKKAQEKLIRQEKLAVLGQMAGGVGHELRNPLGVINNVIYYLKMILPDASEEVNDSLNLLEKETQNATNIISKLLDFARVKPSEPSSAHVTELIPPVLKRKPPPENVIVDLSLPEDQPPLWVDAKQIKQVLDNIIVNAYQAMPEGGMLSIQSSVVNKQYFVNHERSLNSENCIRGADNCLRITVRDTGEGISPQNMEKIFQPLFTTKNRGIGLGLAISKKLIEANQGWIEVESEEGKGSKFKIYLPVVGKAGKPK